MKVDSTMVIQQQPADAGAMAADGFFSIDGKLPLNTHGGLLSYGHCGVGGAMAHLVEAHLQMTGRAGTRQAGRGGDRRGGQDGTEKPHLSPRIICGRISTMR